MFTLRQMTLLGQITCLLCNRVGFSSSIFVRAIFIRFKKFALITMMFKPNRIHAEFQLNEPPLLPFWFTPGQFLGNIVIQKDGSHVHSLHLAVPNNRSLNVGEYSLVLILT